MRLFCLPSRAEGHGLLASGRDCRRPDPNTVHRTHRVCGAARRSRFLRQPAMHAHSPAAVVDPAAGPAVNHPRSQST